MKRAKILERLREAKDSQQICNLWTQTDANYWNVWPLMVSEKLAICARDEDFRLNGYVVFAIDAIDRVVIKDDKCAEFSRMEGMLTQLNPPDVACTDWRTFSASLPEGKLIALERRNCPDHEADFIVGRIVKVGKKRLHMLYLSPDAVWEREPWKIPYEEILQVSFDERYLNVFAKYAGEAVQAEAR